MMEADSEGKEELKACLLKLVFGLNLIKFMEVLTDFPRFFRKKIDPNEMWTLRDRKISLEFFHTP